MFTKGQLVFALLFVIAFVAAMIIAYRRDKSLHQKFYKGSYKILLGFFVFLLILFLIKITLKR